MLGEEGALGGFKSQQWLVWGPNMKFICTDKEFGLILFFGMETTFQNKRLLWSFLFCSWRTGGTERLSDLPSCNVRNWRNLKPSHLTPEIGFCFVFFSPQCYIILPIIPHILTISIESRSWNCTKCQRRQETNLFCFLSASHPHTWLPHHHHNITQQERKSLPLMWQRPRCGRWYSGCWDFNILCCRLRNKEYIDQQ